MSTNILLLGGARRVAVAEQLVRSGKRLGTEIKLFSYELFEQVPIAIVAKVIVGKKWADPEVVDDIIATAREYGINIIIPFIDGAIEIAAKVAAKARDIFVPAPDPGFAEMMFDKITAARVFKEADIPIPATYTALNAEMPAIAKPRHGSASRGIKIFRNIDDLMHLENLKEYLVQEFVEHNREYTVDCYVSRTGEPLVTVPRLRIEVMGGEVTRTQTVRNETLINMSLDILNKFPFRGPVTLQFLEDLDTGRFMLMEINPRLGGGVVCSVYAGAPILDYILEEYKGLTPKPCDDWAPDTLMARYMKEAIFFNAD